MAHDREIKDFGEKIGGAKKDLWCSRGLGVEDIEEFNDAEKEKYVKKNNIWPTPDYEKMVEDGYAKTALYFIKAVKDALPVKPSNHLGDKEASIKGYIEFITDCREKLLQVKTETDVDNFKQANLKDTAYGKELLGTYSREGSKLSKAVGISAKTAKEDAMEKDFLFTYEEKVRECMEKIDFNDKSLKVEYNPERRPLYPDSQLQIAVSPSSLETYFYYSPRKAPENTPEYYQKNPYIISNNRHHIQCAFPTAEARDSIYEAMIKAMVAQHEHKEAEKAKAEAEEEQNKVASPRKTKLMPPQLEHIERTPDMPTLMNVQGQDFIDDFGIKGGEFGNWLNDNDRQANMTFAWMAFKDIALALGIKDSDIALGGKLNIAFGARGSGSALAHYELEREVINLTKMRGAGSLGHEYFHALDNIIGKKYGADFLTTAQHNLSQHRGDDLMKAVKELVSAIRKRQMTPEEVANKLSQDREKYINQFNYVIDRFLPETGLNDAQKAELADIKKQLFEIVKTFDIDEYNKWEETSMKNDGSRSGTRYDIVNDFAEKNKYTPIWLVLCSKIHNFAIACEDVAFVFDEKAYTQMLQKMYITTDFANNAAKLDDIFSKSGHKNYWGSIEELSARAFACYLKDKLAEQGIRDDYLVGHAEMPGVSIDGKKVYTYPVGVEREAINKAFDKLIETLKEKEILHKRDDEVSLSEPEITVSLNDLFDEIALSQFVLIDSSTNNCIGVVDVNDCLRNNNYGTVLSWLAENLAVVGYDDKEVKCDVSDLINKHTEVFEEFCTTHFNAELTEENALFIVEGLIAHNNSEQDYEDFCTLLEQEQEKDIPLATVDTSER